jgi:acyl-CoA synthetase (AMP-forming)/AMP-acid ligase II
MSSELHAFPTVGSQTLVALRRYSNRTAFAWDGGSLTGRVSANLIGRLKMVYASHGLRRGAHIAMLTGNRVETWCAGIAAQLSGMAITWLNGLASLEDQLAQLEDFEADGLVVDPKATQGIGTRAQTRRIRREPAAYADRQSRQEGAAGQNLSLAEAHGWLTWHYLVLAGRCRYAPESSVN